MMIQEFVLNDGGVLTFEEHYSCCYSGKLGAWVKNKTLIISPQVKKIKCVFTGKIEMFYQKNGKPFHETIKYNKIQISSKLKFLFDWIKSKSIKKVIVINEN